MKYLITILASLAFFSCKKREIVMTKPEGDLIASIAFGSCNRQNKEQILWDDVLTDDPDMWIWLGDNIYGDTSDPEKMKSKYQRQKGNRLYQELNQKTQIYGIWDDHDYGKNDAGKEYLAKDTMRDLMFDFLEVPRTNEAWNTDGAYQSYDLKVGELKVKLVLLDSRYFRDEAVKEEGIYVPNLSGSILGDAQWLWLEKELENVEADILIVGNGIQVIPEEHKYEKWANFPNERKKLLSLLSSVKDMPTILLSGDRHLTEVSKLEGEKPIYEITSSGMTHTYTGFVGEANKHRIGEVVTKKSYGLLKIFSDKGGNKIVFEARGDGNQTFLQIPIDY